MTVDSEAVVDSDYEYRWMKLPPGISRLSASTRLSIHAEFAGWELSTVRLYSDGTRTVWLRRRRTLSSSGLPGLIA